jgi:hypothetical protein
MATTSEISERRRARIVKLISDPRYWDKTHPENAKVFAEAQQAFRDAYPEPTGDGQTRPATIHVRAYTRVQDGKEIDVSAYDRTQEIALHIPKVDRVGIPDYLQDIAEGPIHRRTKAEIVKAARAHGDIVETEIRLVSIHAVPTRVDVLGMTPSGFLYIIEIKTPGYPKFGPNQLMVYPLLEIGKHVYSTSPRIRSFGFEPGQLLPAICAYGAYKAPGQRMVPFPISISPGCQPSINRTQ